MESERALGEALSEAVKKKLPVSVQVRLKLLLTQAQRMQFRLGEAEQTAREALGASIHSRDQSLYARALDQMAEVLIAQKNYVELEGVAQEALRLEEGQARPELKRLAETSYRLGLAKYRVGKPDEAFPLLEDALAMVEHAYGSQHKETGRLLADVGNLCRAQGLREKAHAYMRRALYIHEHVYGSESPEAVAILHQLAASMEECGDIDGAAALYERALLKKENVVGGDLDSIAETQLNLAGIYVDWCRYSRARELLGEAIGTFRRNKGPRLAMAYSALAHVELECGHHQLAVDALAQAGKVWESMGADHTANLIANLEQRIELLQMLHKNEDVKWLREKLAVLKPPSEAAKAESAA